MFIIFRSILISRHVVARIVGIHMIRLTVHTTVKCFNNIFCLQSCDKLSWPAFFWSGYLLLLLLLSPDLPELCPFLTAVLCTTYKINTVCKHGKIRQDQVCYTSNSLPASVAQLDAPSDWKPGGRGFNPRRGRQHSFVEIYHDIFSMVILPLPLIQEEQLSVSGERMCTILVNRLEE